jgi:basic amino acid/polyamine antiporter, APA family
MLLILIVMGSCIGSGIFMTPSGVAQAIPHAGLLIPVWILGGLITLSGALSYGELSARYPQAGGVYVYLRAAYGPLTAFLFGWVILMAVTSGAIAGLSLGFAKFLNVFIPLDPTAQKLVAVGVILFCTVVNIGGASVARSMTGIVTTLKVMGIVGLIVAGLAFVQTPVDVDWSVPALDWGMLNAVLLGLVGVYWSYGGWHHLTYLSGEMPDARNRLAGAMLIGVMAAYVAVNIAYMRVLPLAAMQGSEGVAADMMQVVFGEVGGKLLAALVCISVFGSTLIYTMSAPRIYAAMAADGVFFPALAKLHPRTGTPALAIALQSGWAIALLFFWGTFGNLVDYVTYTEAVFLVMAAAAVYIFRWRDRKAGLQHVGFKVPGYPFTPLIYVVISMAFVVKGMLAKTDLAWAAGVLFFVGTGLYFWFRWQQLKALRNKSSEAPPKKP